MEWRHHLRVRTSNPEFLWKMVLAVLVTGAILGFLVQFLPVRSQSPLDEIYRIARTGKPTGLLSVLRQAGGDRDTEFENYLDILSLLSELKRAWDPAGLHSTEDASIDDEEVLSAILDSQFSEQERTMAGELWSSLRHEDLTEPLLNLSRADPSVRFANHAVAVFWSQRDDFVQAGEAYRKEGEHPDAELSREAAVKMFAAADDYESLAEVDDDPRYKPFFTPNVRNLMASGAHDWWAMWWSIPAMIIHNVTPAASVLAVLAGVGWFLFSLQAGQWSEKDGVRWWMCILAMGLGFLSIWPTDFLIDWQEFNWGLEDSLDLFPGIKFYVAGVGLREEFSKLLLLLPLMPLLVKRGSSLEVLIVSACVGLGFATLENEQYFSRSPGATIPRFVTANFFHMAATGLVGMGIARAFWFRGQRILDAVAIFVVIVFAHGMYDAFLSLPAIAEYSMVSFIIYVLLAYQFFRELRPLRKRIQETISLTAVFLACVSLLTSLTFVYLASQFGWAVAMGIMFPRLMTSALMVYMFLREMPNSLVTV